MKPATARDSISVHHEIESRPCSLCGLPMEYQGPSGVSMENADQAGGCMVCPHGHIEAVDINN